MRTKDLKPVQLRKKHEIQAVLQIRDVYPGSGSRVKKIPDPRSGSSSKSLSIFNLKNCFSAFGNMIRDVYTGSGS